MVYIWAFLRVSILSVCIYMQVVSSFEQCFKENSGSCLRILCTKFLFLCVVWTFPFCKLINDVTVLTNQLVLWKTAIGLAVFVPGCLNIRATYSRTRQRVALDARQSYTCPSLMQPYLYLTPLICTINDQLINGQ